MAANWRTKFRESRIGHRDKTSELHFLLPEKFTFFQPPKIKQTSFEAFVCSGFVMAFVCV